MGCSKSALNHLSGETYLIVDDFHERYTSEIYRNFLLLIWMTFILPALNFYLGFFQRIQNLIEI
jgi:hypothetical protein